MRVALPLFHSSLNIYNYIISIYIYILGLGVSGHSGARGPDGRLEIFKQNRSIASVLREPWGGPPLPGCPGGPNGAQGGPRSEAFNNINNSNMYIYNIYIYIVHSTSPTAFVCTCYRALLRIPTSTRMVAVWYVLGFLSTSYTIYINYGMFTSTSLI